jgi:hypothetical protein
MVGPTCTLYITIRVTGKSYSQTIKQGIHTSTSAQPLGTHPHVLSHRDVILNRSLSQLSPQKNHLEYHIVSSLTQRRTTHPSHGHPHPTQGDTSSHLIPETNDAPISWAHPPHGLSHMSTQLSLRGERVLENVSRSCNHQHCGVISCHHRVAIRTIEV